MILIWAMSSSPDQVVGYEYGKQTDGGLKPRDHVYPASALLLERVRNFWE